MPLTVKVWKCIFHFYYFSVLAEKILKESFQMICFKDTLRESDKFINSFHHATHLFLYRLETSSLSIPPGNIREISEKYQRFSNVFMGRKRSVAWYRLSIIQILSLILLSVISNGRHVLNFQQILKSNTFGNCLQEK